MIIEDSHGYLLDSEGRVVQRFGDWDPGDHSVPNAVDSVEYVDGPAAHSKPVDWRYRPSAPPVEMTADSGTIVNDGADSLTLSVTLHSDADGDRDATLDVQGSSFGKTLSPGQTVTETITTTSSSGTVITATVDGPDIQSASTEIEVVSA